MTANNTIASFNVDNRTAFRSCLSRTDARTPCNWTFDYYTFEQDDVVLVKQLSCQRLSLIRTSCSSEPSEHSLQQELLSLFLALKNVGQLTINLVLIDNPLPRSPELYLFVYRTPISQFLTSAEFILPERIDHSLAKGLEYASGITALKVEFRGLRSYNYVYRYFSSANLKEIEFRHALSQDCIALVREKRDKALERLTTWDSSIWDSEVVSKYVSGALLRESGVVQVQGAFLSNDGTALSKYLSHLFNEYGIQVD